LLAKELERAPNLHDAFAHCRRIALGHYENFSIASWLLPRGLRPHMYALYAYCRGVDDLGDEADGDRLALLDGWEAELRRCYRGTPGDIRFVALQQTIRTFDIPPEPFERLIEANRRDQTAARYETFGELLEYCTHSANPVGRLVLYVFGYRDAERQRLSDATCTALQLTNFWQDVSVDLQKGRIYIPLEDMRTFGYGEADLLAARETEAFRRLMSFQAARTRDLFREGLGLIQTVRGRLRMDLRLFSLGGLAVLDAIERADYGLLSRRPRLGKLRKATLALRGLIPVTPAVKEAK
jgi:squalene synthase HpnC